MQSETPWPEHQLSPTSQWRLLVSPQPEGTWGCSPFPVKETSCSPRLGKSLSGEVPDSHPPKDSNSAKQKEGDASLPAHPATVAGPRLPGTQAILCLRGAAPVTASGDHLSNDWSASRLPPASPDGVTKQTSLWGHGQQKDQFRFYQIFPSCVFYAKTAKNSDLNNSLRILSGVGVREDRCTLSSSSH